MFASIPLVFKLPLLVSEAICMRISGTPPNPPAPSGRLLVPDWREKFLRSLGWPSAALRILSWLAGFTEFIIILAYYHPRGPISNVILKHLVCEESCVAKLHFTPLFIIGNALNLGGTMLRVQCYRTLGRLFTFELRIQKDHRLITDGPYAYVRHPSYTGLILTIIGTFLSHVSGSWVVQCGMLRSSYGQAIAIAWMFVASAVVLSLLLRLEREDDLLRKTFGDRWTVWSRNVPYLLIPGIY